MMHGLSLLLYESGGKSGQRRAPHHLTGGMFNFLKREFGGTESVAENYTAFCLQEVRVKT